MRIVIRFHNGMFSNTPKADWNKLQIEYAQTERRLMKLELSNIAELPTTWSSTLHLYGEWGAMRAGTHSQHCRANGIQK